MRSMMIAAFAANMALASCETAAPSSDEPAGIRREPCGGGPLFPRDGQEEADSPDRALRD